VPRNHKEGLTLDEKNGNTKYQDAKKLDMSQHAEYSTFKSLGRGALVQMDTRRYVYTLFTTSSTTVVTRQDLWLEDTSRMFLFIAYTLELYRYKTFVSVSSLQNSTTCKCIRYLGVPIKGKLYMFGDNQSVVTSLTIPHSKLNKRPITLLYHWVQEAIAAKVLDFLHIDGKTDPANVLSKYCGHIYAWPHLKWLFFWQGAPPLEGEVPIRKGSPSSKGKEVVPTEAILGSV
jgi:hypothetical protein